MSQRAKTRVTEIYGCFFSWSKAANDGAHARQKKERSKRADDHELIIFFFHEQFVSKIDLGKL